ncbi:MAG: DUF1800 domain-containing protein [Wenzhouxiangella sp.]|nr:MAG: DUF1800 domain-containing protein [Wenzhouxiangella sp.]
MRPIPDTAGLSHLRNSEDDRIFADTFVDDSSESVDFARMVMERLTYGATPSDVSSFLSLGDDSEARLEAWLNRQLDWQNLPDANAQSRLDAAGYSTLSKTTGELWADHVRGSMSNWPQRYFPVTEVEDARFLRAIYSNRQLHEMMVEFWHDHFNVYGRRFEIAPVFSAYDRDAIRPFALGNFREMLEHVARSTAMLYYLDNRSNRSGGYNENWARELMELHTLGVDAYYPGAMHGQVPIGSDGIAVGYSDADVYDAARCFTGWTVRNGHGQLPGTPEYDTGEFIYWSPWHEGGQKPFMGQFIPNTGQQEARLVMDLLARHPATARHICAKLCRRFIADDPPQALVDSAAEVWRLHWDRHDQIQRVLRHILNVSSLTAGAGQKVRRPFEMVTALLRKTNAEFAPGRWDDWQPYGEFFNRFQQTGHSSFEWPAPDGYPDVAMRWLSASSMGQTWRLISRMPELRMPDDGPFLLGIHDITLSGLPQASQRTARNLADWWIERLIGRPVQPQRRAQVIDFLRQNADADAPLDLTSNAPYGSWSGNNLSAHFTPVRLRVAVSLIAMFAEFHQR